MEKVESDQADALNAKKEVEDKANAIAEAYTEVKTALNLLIDTVNRSLLFIAQLKKEGKFNRCEMI